jgi:hypothetical protein
VCAVDPADLKIDAFADTQAAGVDNGEAGVVSRLIELIQNAPDLVDAPEKPPSRTSFSGGYRTLLQPPNLIGSFDLEPR